MAGSNDFTGQNIQDSYQRVLQLSSSGQLADGTGSLVPLLDVTASFATSADTASFATNFTASGNISASGNMLAYSFRADDNGGFRFKSNNVRLLADITGDNLQIFGGGLDAQGNITASGNISANGNIIGIINGGTF